MTSLPMQQISPTQERVRRPRHVPLLRKTGFLIRDSSLNMSVLNMSDFLHTFCNIKVFFKLLDFSDSSCVNI